MNYDQWKTSEPDDAALCEEHGRPQPCHFCKLYRLIDRADQMRKERIENPREEQS